MVELLLNSFSFMSFNFKSSDSIYLRALRSLWFFVFSPCSNFSARPFSLLCIDITDYWYFFNISVVSFSFSSSLSWAFYFYFFSCSLNSSFSFFSASANSSFFYWKEFICCTLLLLLCGICYLSD